MSGLDFGRQQITWRSRSGSGSFRIARRTLVVVVIGGAIAIAIALVSLATGSLQLSIGEVVNALLGRSSRLTRTVVVDWRLPRVLVALLFGIALGLSGAIFQSITRNPLGSPDIIGFDAGAYSGALIVMLVLHASSVSATTLGALVGGIATAGAVYLLAFRRGVRGFRLILVGIGVSAMLTSLNTWLQLTASREDAMSASFWGNGSLSSVGPAQLVVAAIAFAILFPAVVLLARPMRALDLGDDSAKQLGVDAERTRLLLILVGVALSATVTSLAGPVAFVALCSPQIARRLARSAGIPLVASAAVGAVVLLGSDWVAQHAFGSISLPTGVVTVVFGGAYFVRLLMQAAGTR